MVCSGYKWLLAGFGNGFIALSDHFFERTDTNRGEFYQKVFSGHFNILAASSLVFAFDYLMSHDFEQLVKKNKNLSFFSDDFSSSRAPGTPMLGSSWPFLGILMLCFAYAAEDVAKRPQHRANMAQHRPNMSPTWAQLGPKLGPSWGQVGSKLGQEWMSAR